MNLAYFHDPFVLGAVRRWPRTCVVKNARYLIVNMEHSGLQGQDFGALQKVIEPPQRTSSLH